MDVVAVLIGRQQEGTGGIEAKVSRGLASRWLMLDVGKQTKLRIDRENDNAIMPAVRTVNKFPRRMHANLRSRIVPTIFGRQSRNGLDPFEFSGIRIMLEDGYFGGHLQVEVSKLSRRMKGQVPGSSTRGCLDEWRIVSD